MDSPDGLSICSPAIFRSLWSLASTGSSIASLSLSLDDAVSSLQSAFDSFEVSGLHPLHPTF